MMEPYSVTDEVQELTFPTDSTPIVDGSRIKELQKALQGVQPAMEKLSEAATRAAESFKELREEGTMPGIYNSWMRPDTIEGPLMRRHKYDRAKLKKQKRKRGGPR